MKFDLSQNSRRKRRTLPKATKKRRKRKVIKPVSAQKVAEKMRKWSILKIFIIILPMIFLFGIVPWLLMQGSALTQSFLKSSNFTITAKSLHVLTTDREPEMKKSEKNITNAMIVGIDTRPDDKNGLKNTDSIMVISYNHNTNETTLISFPRDILVRYPDTYSYGKINSVYMVGEKRKEGTGLTYLKKALEDITGQPIHYYAMVNLDGFRKVINLLDGIEVNVPNGFTDYAYPTDSYGWKIVSFKAGPQTMNGETALAYARSRHAQGVEGSDFARARRQQIVIEAVFNKFKKTETLQNPVKLYNIAKTLSENIRISSLNPEDLQAGLNIMTNGSKIKINKIVLEPTLNNWSLMQEGGASPAYGYHVIPRAGLGNWTVVRQYINKIIAPPSNNNGNNTQ